MAADPDILSLLSLPIEAVADIPGVTVERRRGRPRKVMPMPTVTIQARQDWLRKAVEEHAAADAVCAASAGGGDQSALLDVVIEQVAVEASALRFDAEQRQPGSRERLACSGRRLRALRSLAALVVERERLRAATGIPNNKAVEKVGQMFIDKLCAVVRETLAPEAAEQLVQRLTDSVGGWPGELGVEAKPLRDRAEPNP